MKYAVTGSLPPGKNSGQAFIHDPKSIGQSIVKANIKMRFTNCAGTSMVLVRAMELKQNKSTMSFKALDGVIRATDPSTGKRVSMSHKCTELDRQIPLLLGISKPILEHVVFCHQEDASWPLMDSAVLKKRFDDIFDSTRYTKALKNIAEIKKDYSSRVKDLKAEVAGLASHRHAARGFRNDKEQQQYEMDRLDDKLKKYRVEMEELEKEKAAAKEVADKVWEMKNELEERRNALELNQSVLNKQRSLLEKDMTETHTTRDLRDILRNYQATTSEMKEQRDDLDHAKLSLKSELEKLRQEQYSLQSQLGKLEEKEESLRDLCKQRLQKMEAMAQSYSIDLTITQQTQDTQQESSGASTVAESQRSLSLSDDDMTAFYTTLEHKQQDLTMKLKQHKNEAQGQEDKIQSILNELDAKIKNLEMNRQTISEEQKKIREELNQIKGQKQAKGGMRKTDIEEAKKLAAAAVKRRDGLYEDPRRQEIPIEIRSLEEKLHTTQTKIEDEQTLLRELRSNQSAQNEIDLLREEVKKDAEALSESIKEQDYELKNFRCEVPDDLFPNDFSSDAHDFGEDFVESMASFRSAIRDKYESENLKLSKASDELSRKERMVSEKLGLLKHSKQQLTDMRNKIVAFTSGEGSVEKFDRIVRALKKFETQAGRPTNSFDANDAQNVANFLSNRIDEIDDSARGEVSPEAVSKIMTLLRREAKKPRGDGSGEVDLICPCCLRGMTDRPVVRRFQDNMRKLGGEDSILIKQSEEKDKEKAARSNYAKWRKTISSVMGDLVEFKRINAEIPKLEKTTKELEVLVADLREEKDAISDTNEEAQSTVKEIRALLDCANLWVEDGNRIFDKQERLRNKDQELTMTLSMMDSGGRKLRDVERDLDAKRNEKDDFQSKIGKLNKELSALNNNISLATSKASNLEKNAAEKEAKFKADQEALVRKQELGQRSRELTESDNEIQKQITPLRNKMRSKETEKQKQREFSKVEEDRLSNVVNVFTAEVNDLKNTTKQIDRISASRDGNNFEKLNKKVDGLKSKIPEKEKELDAVIKSLETKERDLKDKDSYRKIVQENLEILQAQTKTAEIERDIETLDEELKKIDGHDTYEEKIEGAEKKLKELGEMMAKHEGRRNGFVEQIRSLQRKLQTSEYKNIEERHSHALIRQTTTQEAVSDLDVYWHALDRALLRYHGIKIEEINKIIRELWMLTYKGEDITNIKLVSSPESRAAKSYNYRVVMTKGSTELDMRGRCSAGQRVLASIVIRLALAETFCVNCGFIALDEPTVNLDFENKRGLAVALAQIIAFRAKQSNFQLVIITHDETFVSMMKTELAGQTGFSLPDRYFQVRREESELDGKYYSKIEAVDWDEIS